MIDPPSPMPTSYNNSDLDTQCNDTTGCAGSSCDSRIENGPYSFTCEILESDFDCDCTGCACVNSGAPSYDSAPADFEGTIMRGLPFSASIRKFDFCVAPGDYTLSAVDVAGNGWWGGARYLVKVNDAVVVNEEMGVRDGFAQRASFTVTIPGTARSMFQGNKALQGGGGAVFWENASPGQLESYRNESDNAAMYGDYAATPARTISASRDNYDAVSGHEMSANGIMLDLMDRCVSEVPISSCLHNTRSRRVCVHLQLRSDRAERKPGTRFRHC